MTKIQTWPTPDQIQDAQRNVPDYMRKNDTPTAVVLEGWLDDDVCDRIVDYGKTIEPYKFPQCHATTREMPRPLDECFREIEDAARNINHVFWDYLLDPEPAAWMQQYTRGDGYALHADGSIGQTRKLTAVALLSDPYGYEGGDLTLYNSDNHFVAPRTSGTIVFFPPWVQHDVSLVTLGIRRTVNMGFYGPHFR